MLRPDQQRALDFLLATPYAALWARMGSGKTLVTLTAIKALLDSYAACRVLIVAPKRVALHTWPDEAAKWGFDFDVTPPGWEYDATLRASRVLPELEAAAAALKVAKRTDPNASTEYVDRLKAELAEARRVQPELHEVTIIGVDMLWRVWALYGKNWPFDTVVLDESSMYKAHDSKRHKVIRWLRKQDKLARLVQLTGTPAGNGLIDVHGQARLLDEKILGGLTAFRDRWFDADWSGYGYTPKAHAAEDISRILAPVTLVLDGRHTEKPVINDVPVYLDTEAMGKYKTMESTAVLQLEDVTAVNAAVLVAKLAQIASGYVYDGERNAVPIHRAKYDALQDVIDGMAGEPLLIIYNYQHERAALEKLGAVDLKDTTPEAWNAGRVPLMCLHPKSGGHGLNLQDGGATMVWFSLTWSLELYEQVIARLDRSGQKKQVIVHRLMAVDTIDEYIAARLSGKDMTQQDLIRRLKNANQ